MRSILRDLRAIGEAGVTADSFRKVQLHSNNGFYRFLLNVCELIYGSWLVDRVSGAKRFRDFERDERKMARVFQDFLYNFLRVHRIGTQVRREHIGWKVQSQTDPNLTFLPRMETDISLRRPGACLIIDAKYYQSTLSDYYDTHKLHSGNLYQLLSYLTNAQRGNGEILSGMLIYPRVDRTLREDYEIQGYRVHIRTLDLSQDWRSIDRELREIVAIQ